MVIDKNDNFHIIAEEGKVFKRKSDGLIFGEEIFLGYTYYINGEKLDEPHLEVPEDFEEVDTPEEYKEKPEEVVDEEAEKLQELTDALDTMAEKKRRIMKYPLLINGSGYFVFRSHRLHHLIHHLLYRKHMV